MAINNNKYFKDKIIYSKFFFILVKWLKKSANTGIFKNRLKNIKSIEILRNVEILAFIIKSNIGKYKEIILDNLKDNIKLKKFVSYLNNYIFKLNPSVYNYKKLLNYKGPNLDNAMNKLYLTNNKCKSIYAKL